MKTFGRVTGTLLLALFAALASSSAMADYRGHGGHGHGGYGYRGGHAYHGGVRFGVTLGFPLYGLGYYPGRYYGYPYPAYGYPPVVVAPASPPIYVEQGSNQAAPSQAQGDWYYCAASKAYYPYVAECPAGWQRVPAQPPAQ